jgi:adenylylsulfate kinase
MSRGAPYAELVGLRAGGVLITGVYGSGKSSVAAEISYLLERRRQPHALLDLDYLGWGGSNFDDHAAGFGLMLRNLAAVASNYRDAGISVFVVAYFIRNHHALSAVREATGVPLRVVRLSVPLPDIEQRLATDMTSGRRDDLREAASSIAAGEGVGVEDVTVVNDQPIGLIAHEVMTWLGWR